MTQSAVVASGSLLKVVEVHPEQSIRCRAPGCNRPVYKRIHVVRTGDGLTVVGSDCFERLFGVVQPGDEAALGGDASGAGRLLSADERALLEANTEAFIAQMRAEYAQLLEAQIAQEEAALARDEEARARHIKLIEEEQRRITAAQLAQEAALRERERLEKALEAVGTGRRIEVESEVRSAFKAKYQIDVSQPGWLGWYEAVVRERLLEGMGMGTLRMGRGLLQESAARTGLLTAAPSVDFAAARAAETPVYVGAAAGEAEAAADLTGTEARCQNPGIAEQRQETLW